MLTGLTKWSFRLDDKMYYIIGALIVSNFGTIVTIIIYAGRAVWWLSKMESKVDNNTKDINAAHEKIRILERGH